MAYKSFYNDWVDISNLFKKEPYQRYYDHLIVHLDTNFFQNLKFDCDTIRNYRIDCAIKSSQILGHKPALCLSGGIDSQAMVQCWLEARLYFDLFILVFKNDLNKQDVEHARTFARNNGVYLQEIEIDILQFLNRENFDYAIKYDSASPHFNAHYKLFNVLKSKGYTGICCGGDSPIKNVTDNTWGSNFNRNPLNFVNYSSVENLPVIGSFLSYTPELAWSISLLTNSTILPESKFYSASINHIEQANSERYANKCEAYLKAGLNIMPQKQKYTGFELVKKLLEEETGNGWEFEQRYRYPLQKMLRHPTSSPYFVFRDEVEHLINSIYSNNMTPSVSSSTGVAV